MDPYGQQQLKNQSGSGLLMGRALGAMGPQTPTNVPGITPGSVNLTQGKAPPMAGQRPMNTQMQRPGTSPGSGNQGSYYAEGQGGPNTSQYYAGNGNWWSNQKNPNMMQRPMQGAGMPNLPRGQNTAQTPQPMDQAVNRQTDRTFKGYGQATSDQGQFPDMSATPDASGNTIVHNNQAQPLQQGQAGKGFDTGLSTSTGTSSQGLAGANPNTTNVSSANATADSPHDDAYILSVQANYHIDGDGNIIDQSGNKHGNIHDPSSYDDNVRRDLDYIKNGGGFKGEEDRAKAYKDQQYKEAQAALRMREHTGNNQAQDFVNNAITNSQNPSVGAPPQFDEAALAESDRATNADYARQRARALRAAAERGAYAGAGADQMAASMGETGIGYDLAAAQDRSKAHLQAKIQNFQAQMDWYNKAFQAKMAVYQNATDEKARQEAFRQASDMAAYQARIQKEMMSYQNQLNNQMSPADWAGGLLGLGTNILSSAAGAGMYRRGGGY
jgi:hypothetical protein